MRKRLTEVCNALGDIGGFVCTAYIHYTYRQQTALQITDVQ